MDNDFLQRPGRACPLHYRYKTSVFKRPAELRADTLYVVGGLYGNEPALTEVLRMRERESVPPTLVFNGDFNWFDIDDDGFSAINETVLSHVGLRGNVETEMASNDNDSGCGCSYPDTVPEVEVERSNRIMVSLRTTARRHPEIIKRLAQLPMNIVAQVGTQRIGIVHGDAESLAGWNFDVTSLDDPALAETFREIFSSSEVNGFASSHTCLPALKQLHADSGWVINNGAAGMPNFASTQFGLLSRISIFPPEPGSSLYGLRVGGIYIDALPIRYDAARWQQKFLANWSAGSPAYDSYYARIVSGPNFALARAQPKVR